MLFHKWQYKWSCIICTDYQSNKAFLATRTQVLRACSLRWWSTARPTSPHFKYIYLTFSRWWRNPHHPLYTALMASTCSEFPYLQFLESRASPLKSFYSAWSRKVADCAQAFPSSSLSPTAKRDAAFGLANNMIRLIFYNFCFFSLNTLPLTKSKIKWL